MKRWRLGLVGSVIALGVGGISWGISQAASQNVISACANADKALFLSTTGSCPSGQTLVQWDMQGPQGPPGPAGQSPPPVKAFGSDTYDNGFSIKAEINQAGDYWIDGSVDLNLKPVAAHNHNRTFKAFCRLYVGPQNGTATSVAQWTMVFHRHAGGVYVPSSVNGPVDVDTVQSVSQSQLPREVYFTCKGGPDAHWTHPTITIEKTVSSVFHQRVGPALPNRPRIGPGPIGRVFG